LNTNKTSKIICIIPSLGSGGMERVMSELVNFFSTQDNIEIHLVVLSKKTKFYAIKANIKIHEPKFSSTGVLGFFKLLNFVRRTIIKVNPISVLSFGEMYNSFVILSLLGLNTTIFVSDRSRPNKDWGILHNKLRNILYTYATGIISQTEVAKDMMYNRIKHKNITVIGNPFHMSTFHSVSPRKNVILTVGRMIKSKQHDQLIKIFSDLPKNDWELHFVGDGPERDNLTEIVKHLYLQGKVHFHGTQKNVNQYYNTSKIFAFTSNSEGFPNVIGEAMCNGMVPICYNFIAGATDLVQHNKNGIIVPLNDQKLFKEGLLALIHNENRLNNYSKEAVTNMQKFDIQSIGTHYLNFILSK
jgi:glycosyltransferase involved in cell wall biosynthesis